MTVICPPMEKMIAPPTKLMTVVVDFVLRTAKVGNQVIVELDVVILPATPLDTVGQQDPLRERLNQAISQQISGYSLWLNINFVGDIK